MIRVSVQPAPIDLGTEIAGVEAKGAGAIASFTGTVRGDDGVTELMLEHYPGMTEGALVALAEEAMVRWDLMAVTMVHRVGTMEPGDRIVFIATAAAHRAAALESCTYLIDRLKTDAPFWKRERRGDSAIWVEARDSDAAAGERWA
ncbi:molybdenum cofactor biosynthesis protein MoaE [Sphingomonas sp. JC676]|uniref:molybdenum cofactor biosynthesis protein MoaE n=1 Tax=Sphingomonas sp. JC676 TaxID=2768065 RepID=UPI001657A2F9|nr:molybdenum cofactor biosynthesis protein MoaE [Sphingomonas sp. JC676]MBC9030876.1 molybdenum cofactor biosynthesis protein MoaE [Sphingomonas sp. JC676]